MCASGPRRIELNVAIAVPSRRVVAIGRMQRVRCTPACVSLVGDPRRLSLYRSGPVVRLSALYITCLSSSPKRVRGFTELNLSGRNCLIFVYKVCLRTSKDRIKCCSFCTKSGGGGISHWGDECNGYIVLQLANLYY